VLDLSFSVSPLLSVCALYFPVIDSVVVGQSVDTYVFSSTCLPISFALWNRKGMIEVEDSGSAIKTEEQLQREADELIASLKRDKVVLLEVCYLLLQCYSRTASVSANTGPLFVCTQTT
jgi:hypothetical protein